MKKRFDFFALVKSLPICLCVFVLNHVGDGGEPFGLALLLGVGVAGFSTLLPAAAFVLSALTTDVPSSIWLNLGQALLLLGALWLRKKLFGESVRGKLLLPFSALTAGLTGFVFLSEFTPYLLPFGVAFLEEPLFQKAIIALTVLLLSAVSVVASQALKHKLLRCKMRTDETIFALLCFVLCGIGFYRFFGENAYMGATFYILLLFCAVTKDAWGCVCAFVLSLPSFLIGGAPVERFFLYGTALVAFSKTGKIGESIALLCAYLFYGYLDGIYTYPTPALIGSLLSVLLPVLLFLLTPRAWLIRLENALVFYRERHLSRLAINRNRNAIAQRLFDVSTVFKEIQTAFLTLGNTDGEREAKNHMQARILNGVCKNCSGYGACIAEGLMPSLEKMLQVGCIKGKVSLIDVPPNLAGLCGRQSDLLYATNVQLSEYRAYVQDAENAACGRQLLANQALGVSEITKELALEQSEPLPVYTKRERALEDALLKAGIVTCELLILGGEEPTVSLVTVGDGKANRIAATVSKLFGSPFCVSEKLTLAKEKYCYVLKKKPPCDAAFGIATKTKDGETFSGDTHSVLRIDERRFLVALSDGMGSGEYAKHVSQNTITLLESFYKAKMPPDLTLSTVNRLLSFSKEETFACVDVAVVDLELGRADVVKIGAPTSFILSDTAVQILEGDGLPLGILERIHPTANSYPLRAGDLLVFLSDGITGAFPSTVDLYDTVQALPKNNPQEFADRLLSLALERYEGVAKDDMTAVAVRIFSA